ncbi:hypothetical protein ICE98_00218 [Lactococcus lactis]|nr:hypothetical protein [Lactococcus lactis]
MKTPFVTKEQLEQITAEYPLLFIFMMKKEFVKKRVTFTKPLLGIKDLKNFLL